MIEKRFLSGEERVFFETASERLEAKSKNVKVQSWEFLKNRKNEL